ncbi:hypothetical protein Plhal304r1_c014g0054181 [Plasmopara halstedii]
MRTFLCMVITDHPGPNVCGGFTSAQQATHCGLICWQAILFSWGTMCRAKKRLTFHHHFSLCLEALDMPRSQ